MATEIMRLFARVGADITEFRTAMREVDQTGKGTAATLQQDLGGGSKDLTDKFSALALKLSAVAAGLKIVQQIAKAGLGLHDEAERINQVATAYERLAGVDATGGAAELRDATGGALSNVELMAGAMRLMSMNLADSNEEAARLLQIATQLGRLKGLSSTEAINALLPMLTNQSALRLDEFLVSGDAVKRLSEKFEAAGMESGEAFMTAFMQEAEKTLARTGEVGATGAERGAAAWANARAGFAGAMEQGPIGDFFSGARDVWADAGQGIGDYFQRIADGRATLKEAQAEFRKLHEAGLLDDSTFNKLNGTLDQLWSRASAGVVTVDQLVAALNRAGGAELETARDTKQLQSDLSNAAAEAEHLDYVLGLIENRKIEVQVNLSYKEKVARSRAQTAETARWQGQADEYALNPANYGLPTRDDDNTWMNPNAPSPQAMLDYINKRDAALDAYLNPSPTTPGGGRSGVDYAARQVQELRSLVQGLMQPTQVTEADMAATEMGVYQDKWDEYMRRFRMKETGHNPWEIAQEERAFYGGQRMGEVNWDALIAAGFEQKQYEAGQENLLQTAMQKFAEAGVGLDQEQVAGLLGLPQDYASVGKDRAADFAAGVTQTDMGKKITDTVVAQLKAEATTWTDLGEDVADLFLKGFKAGTAGDFLQALVDAILPDVLEVVNK